MKRLLLILGAALALLVAVMLIRAVRIGSPDSAVDPPPHIEVPAGAAERLAGSLRIPTISHEDTTAFDGAAFLALHEYLRAAFPRVHTELRRETVSSYSLLYTWPGSDTSQKSILLAGHLDVVPVEPGTEATWQEEPFGGRVVDGFIWGRGAIDNKAAILGTLEAAEMLLAQGFHPKRTIHLAFGHDEEVGGTRGAREIAAILANRGVELEMVLDEGGVIGDGVLQGIASPVALVGIAEKGFASVELIASSTGGHSSLPPRQSAIGILSTAITRLEASPMPARLEGPTRQLFDRVAPEFPFVQRAIFA
ncbi:MAG TPA: M20/M25/M40 family metallo-hydrolase, partial [Candidatus Eisenbacteria bacterium]|nr:M20/M25/M40 family metallo-hydrolase [Candidatus Eisenbacteria bacterium]